jgi:PAS domain S-box-containing protein
MTDAGAQRTYFQYALNGIIETERGGSIVDANPAACSIIGLSRHRLLGRPLSGLLDSALTEQRNRIARHFMLVSEQGINRVEAQLSAEAGNRAGTIIELSSVDVGNGRIMHLFDDVTEQRTLIAEARQARLAADQANAAKSNFLAKMSHEIRTPLNGVIGLGELLRTTKLDGVQANYVNQLLGASHSLLEILNDLLDFAKIEAGGIRFETVNFDLDVLLRELQAMFDAAARGNGIALTFGMASDVPRRVAGDRLRLSQVLRNLLSNAVKFTERGSVDLRVELAGDQAPLASPEMLRICFAVSDTGIGIDAADQSRIFEAFSQGEVSTERRFGGTGLGLSITRNLVEGMNGTISVTSQPRRGSRFLVCLPFAPAQRHGEVEREAPAPAALGRNEFAGSRVLVAEDNAVNQLVIGDLLRHAGIQVAIAQNGALAIEMLSRPADAGKDAGFAPDLIFMDVQMPTLDGIAATQALRQRGIRLPIVALTAGVSRQEVRACMDAGMNDYLGKPIDLDELSGVLTRWLPARRPTAPHASEVYDAAVRDAEFPGIDLQSALPRFLGDRRRLGQAIRAFVSQHREDSMQLVDLIAKRNWNQAARIAHAIKGGALTLGARNLADMASHFERLANAEVLDGMPSLIEGMGFELDRLAGWATAPRGPNRRGAA